MFVKTVPIDKFENGFNPKRFLRETRKNVNLKPFEFEVEETDHQIIIKSNIPHDSIESANLSYVVNMHQKKINWPRNRSHYGFGLPPLSRPCSFHELIDYKSYITKLEKRINNMENEIKEWKNKYYKLFEPGGQGYLRAKEDFEILAKL